MCCADKNCAVIKNKMTNQQITDFLRENSVCEVCQLRYLKARGNEYKNRKETFGRLNVDYAPLTKCINEEHEDVTEDDCDDAHAAKKQRLSHCTVCLGLFSTEFQDEMLKSIFATDFSKYECGQIVIAISLPMLLQLRQLSMWYALIRKFGEEKIEAGRSPDVPLKEAAKLILNPILCEKLNKQYDANGIMINMQLTHDQEAEEIAAAAKVFEIAFPPAKNGKRQSITRGVLEKFFTPARLAASIFEKNIAIPPTIPSCVLHLEQISLVGPTVYVAGHYRKLTRDLSHTPWVLNGKRMLEDSIEEIIVRSVAPSFCIDHKKIIFMSSGREDVDVRCLGKGRPFVLEIPNSLRTTLSKKEALALELDIEKSLKVSVNNLQMVQREELVHIKTGEEKKRKFYRALCVLQEPITLDVLEKLNLSQGFEIQQKTPIRVLHRRPLHTRPRTIYSLKAWAKRDNTKVIIVDIVSQAGTYIKELVHGEFGRTTPSLSSITGKPIDIIALDVVGIDLDWPPEVDNRRM